MNSNARKWVEALRSGEFKQGRDTLLRSGTYDRYCCLGVACELYRREVGGEWEEYFGSSPDFRASDDPHDKSGYQLPKSVRGWLGLRTSDGENVGRSLIGLNDNGATFTDIADVIEEEPEGLFE